MNVKAAIVCFVALSVSPCFGKTLLALDSLHLKDGRKYQKVTITKQNDDRITFRHAEGFTRIGYQELPDHVAKRLGFTPLDEAGYKSYQNEQARMKAEKIETLKAQEAERIRQLALQREEDERRRAAQAEARRIAAREAAEAAAKRRREQEIAQAKAQAEEEKREQEMLRINPNYKRIQQLQQMRDPISKRLISLTKTPMGTNMEWRNQAIAQLQRELRIIDREILLLTPGRTAEENKQLVQQMELEDQQDQLLQQQKAMKEQLAKETAQIQAETERMREDMEAMRFQQQMEADYQRYKIQQMEQQRRWDEMNRDMNNFMNR